MTRKRRVFDVDLPASVPPEAAPTGALDTSDLPADLETKSMPPSRRGPMATAIGETGDALRHRRAVEAEIRAENDGLAAEFVRLKAAGLVTDVIPLDRITTRKLVRDRRAGSDLDLGDLKASLRDIGLSNPVRVEPVGQGAYELVEGLRRLTAYRELLVETGDRRWGAIPAAILSSGLDKAALYRRMVDENLVRKDIAFAEMASLALAYADAGIDGCADTDAAVNILYASAGPQKRSYIRRFALLMRRLGKVLEHPAAIPRSLGLELADRLEAEPDTIAELVSRLRAAGPDRDGTEEIAVLRAFLDVRAVPPAQKGRGAPRGSARRGRVALTVPVGPGIRCTATDGRVELRAVRDFAAVDRYRLEAAIVAFWSALDDGAFPRGEINDAE